MLLKDNSLIQLSCGHFLVKRRLVWPRPNSNTFLPQINIENLWQKMLNVIEKKLQGNKSRVSPLQCQRVLPPPGLRILQHRGDGSRHLFRCSGDVKGRGRSV
ncbi:hypothetical protein FKM82_003608 [Ascaphus truei]